jgi:hypothetical protein
MFELTLDLGRKAQIWLDEVPPASFITQTIHEVTVDMEEATNTICRQSHLAAIELRLFQGSRPTYGFLGAIFSPEETQKLIIQVAVGESEIPNFQTSIAVAPEIIQVGLSEEYISAIFKQASEMQKKCSSIRSGRITFKYGAYGVFSSNSSIFGFLSQTVMLTIDLLCKEKSQDEILSFVESAIRNF